MKLEYICKECGKTNQIVTFWTWFGTPHFGNMKWLKCKHCSAKRHFMARKDEKWSMIDWPTTRKEK